MSRRSTIPPRKLSATPNATSPRPPSAEHDPEEENANSSDESNLPPFDLAAAVGFLQSVSAPAPTPSSSTSTSSGKKRGRPGGHSGGRWPKKPPVVTETSYCFTLRGPNSLLNADKSAVFTIGGVYELKCAVLSPPRQSYACRTILTLMCDDETKWAELEARMDSGVLLNGQPMPKHIMTMDRPSPRTHRNVCAGRYSLEFTWDASGTIFVYLRFLSAVADLLADPLPLRLCIQSQFLEEPFEPNTRSILLETVGHPSMINTSAGSTGPIDVQNDGSERRIPEDDRQLLFEAPPPAELDDTDFVRNVINTVAKAAAGQESPMAMIEKAIQESLQAPTDANGKFEVRVSAATLGEALGSFLNGSPSSVPSSMSTMGHQPRPRGRPRKFHYPEYCYSKTALQKLPSSNPGEWRGPAAEMQAIQQMQRNSARGQIEVGAAEAPEKRFKMDIVDERPINMANLLNPAMQNEEADKPSSSMEDVEPSAEVKQFLVARRMGNFVSVFAKYSLSEMRFLSSEDCRVICGNDAEGLRLYHSLRQRSTTSGKLRVFVAPQTDDGEEPCYELLNLSPPCVSELQHALRSKQLVASEATRICVDGPNGINVQLSDEIMESWEDNSVFQLSVSNGVLKLVQIGSG